MAGLNLPCPPLDISGSEMGFKRDSIDVVGLVTFILIHPPGIGGRFPSLGNNAS
jgi:hypothetical protein